MMEPTVTRTRRRWTGVLAVLMALLVGACSSTVAGGKDGPSGAVRVIRLGTAESATSPYADEVKVFAKGVDNSTKGKVKIEVVWEAPGPYTAKSEEQLATMVSKGSLDLALVPSRAWDLLGSTSMQALQTPFLIDSFGLLGAVVEGDLGRNMLEGLRPLGVTGIGMWPESMRHPVSYGKPLLTPADFAAATLDVRPSRATEGLMRALGVEPVTMDGSEEQLAVQNGTLTGLESGFIWSNDFLRPGNVTGNITFFGKVNTLVANTKFYSSLPKDVRDVFDANWLDTLRYVQGTNTSERDLANKFCLEGGTVTLAKPDDVQRLVQLAAAVRADLEKDPETKRLISAIEQLKRGAIEEPVLEPQACEPPHGSGPPTTDLTAGPFPEGVYHTVTSLDGEVIFRIEGGVWQRILPNGEVDCEASYKVEAGRIHLTFSPDPTLSCGNPAGVEFLSARWTWDGHTLHFIDIVSDPGAIKEFSYPWTRTA